MSLPSACEATPSAIGPVPWINAPFIVTVWINGFTNDAVEAKLELIAFKTYEAVCAVLTNDAVEAKLELIAFKTYEAVCAVLTNDAVEAKLELTALDELTANDELNA